MGDEQRYYSEPDVKYFEIDYEFLRELRKIARSNCPECKRRARRADGAAYCEGRPHARRQHCARCCRVCARSSDTLDSCDEECSLAARSSSAPRARPAPRPPHPGKSVSFLHSSSESVKDEPNYTAKSFTNDLKRFLLKPSPPRLSLRDKFMISFKQELEATKRSPKLRAIKGLWKSY